MNVSTQPHSQTPIDAKGGLLVGVMMLQGARHEHIEHLHRASETMSITLDIRELRTKQDLEGLDALVLPGGESTTMRLTSEDSGIQTIIQELIGRGIPVLATCAGTILLAEGLNGGTPLLDVTISRNAWGGQRESFQTELELINEMLDITSTSCEVSLKQAKPDQYSHRPLPVSVSERKRMRNEKFPGVFIRAPRFERLGEDVQPVAIYGKEVVAVKQDNIIALTFHPELTNDSRFHLWLLKRAIDASV